MRKISTTRRPPTRPTKKRMSKSANKQAEIKRLKRAITDLNARIALGQNAVKNATRLFGETHAENYQREVVEPFERKKEKLKKQLKKLS